MNDVPYREPDIPPTPIVTTDARPVRRGCRSRLLWLLFGLLMTPVFICGLLLLVYLTTPPPRINILIVGLDSRRGDDTFEARTDSIMVVGIHPAQLQASLLSIPRDLFIDVKGYGSQRINTINVLGEEAKKGSGAELLSSAISSTFGVPINRYVRLKFQGFVDLIDAVGGVTIDVERTIVDDAYPTENGGTISVRFKKSGVQYMDGERALIYARTRHSDDDYQRAARQQQVLTALMGKLANPVHWLAALNVLRQSVDTNVTIWDMAMIAPPIILNRGRFDQLVINRDYIVGSAEGNAKPDLAKIVPWLEGRFR